MKFDIYTSNYNTVLQKVLPQQATMVRISAGYPEWFDTYCDNLVDFTELLAPPWWLIRRYKTDRNWESYVEDYTNEVLNKTTPEEVMQRLEVIWEENGRKPLILLCYCNDKVRCHRHLDAEFLGLQDCEIK